MKIRTFIGRALAACVLFLLTGFGPTASAQNFDAQEQAEIRALVRDYLIRNPDVLREALDALDARANAERWQAVRSDRRDFSIGPADAPVVIVEFYDYRCPYCHAAAEWVAETLASRNDVRFVFKELPILSDESMESARAVLAAAPQGRTWAFHRALMAFRGDLTPARIDALARQSGVDVARMRRAMASDDITRHLEQNRAYAVGYDISGTPGFIINGELVPGFDANRLNERVRVAAREARERRTAQR